MQQYCLYCDGVLLILAIIDLLT